jgi:3-oxo-5-alpha-steroid 4-dehydrogenase 1
LDKVTFNLLVWCWIFIAVLVFIILLFVKAPYGRHASRKWGITISNRWGWFLMEIISPSVFLYFFIIGETGKNFVTWIIAGMFLLHYANRSLVYPFRIKTKGKRMPVMVVLMAVVFNLANGSILGYFMGNFQTAYFPAWMTDFRFISGTLLFFAGMYINLSSDEKLIHLRRTNPDEYKIPRGGMFNLISCPNFFGEMVEWLGYAVLCWSLPALSFFVWTFCNLVPRALNHHRWYKQFFPEYPVDRKAILPFVL